MGFGAISGPLPRSGGGAVAPVAIPMMLGSGASTAPALLWTTGDLPALTTIGAAAVSSASAVLVTSDDGELEDFVELGAEGEPASSEAELVLADA